ncbi:hypothetical protein QOT17_25630 [Balamuthia mandrillaris]
MPIYAAVVMLHRKNSRRAAALRSLWQYVQFTCVEQTHRKAWAPSHLVHTPSFAAASNNVFNLAEAKDTVPLLLAALHQSLLRQGSSSSSSPHDKANKKKASSSSSSSDRVTVPLFETTKKKHQRQLKDKKVNIANDEDRLMSVLEEKLLALSLLAALSVAFSVETALDVVDTFLPVVAQLALTEASQDELAVGGKERKNQTKDEVQASALLRCAAVELHTELLYLQLLHLPSSFPHGHTIHPRNRKNGPLEQAERFRRATSRMVTWDQLYEEAVKLIRLLLHDECCSVRRTAVSMLAFWISVFPTALVHSFFNDFFEELVELLEDQDLFVRTEAGQALATLLLLNLDEEDDDPNSKKEAAAEEEEEEEEEREEHYYEVGSFALLQVEEKVKELCWQRDFKFDRKGNGLQFKTFKRLREVVKHCRQLEEDREEALRNDRAQLTRQQQTQRPDEENEGEDEQEPRKVEEQAALCEEERTPAELFFRELRVPLTDTAYLRLQKQWHGVLALRCGDKVEWKVRWWRGIVQLQTLSRIIGPSLAHSITVSFLAPLAPSSTFFKKIQAEVLIARVRRIAEKSALVVSSSLEDIPFSPAVNQSIWYTPPHTVRAPLSVSLFLPSFNILLLLHLLLLFALPLPPSSATGKGWQTIRMSWRSLPLANRGRVRERPPTSAWILQEENV